MKLKIKEWVACTAIFAATTAGYAFTIDVSLLTAALFALVVLS